MPRSNLPLQTSSFVGRERELAEVRALQASSRLLTLTGPGGSGKTRLALETAAGLAGDFRDGVFWVELSAISDPGLITASVARVLGVRGGTGLSPEEALLNHLEDKQTLLVLDNCEHLVGACAGFADALLRSCQGLKILATSREAFRIPGERAWIVPSLSLPDPQSKPKPKEAARFEAVSLFVQRVAAVVPNFTLTEENTAAVVRICERLDGIPLAIELAAARVRVLSPSQIASRLDDRFLLLTGGSRVAVPRQRTLRAAMDWSHELLSGRERALFRRLSAFTGGFSLEAAEAVCSADDIDRDEILGLLFRLVDKSLVLVVRGEERDEARYLMPETVLRYASEKLGEAGEEDRVRSRHADFFLRRAEEAEPGLVGAEQGTWLGRLDTDHANLRTAMGWYAARGEPEAIFRLAGALWWFWFMRGHYGEGREWLEGALAKGGDTPSKYRAKALTAAGDLAFLQSEYGRATERLEEGLALYRTLGDERGIASAVQLLGSIAREQGHYEQAETFHGESLALWRGLEDDWGVAQSLNYLGFVAWLRGDYD
ncbi:MAG: ATP-binding protein, partial [Rubrobacter sp.]